MSINPIKIAIIDMYDDTSNLGMTCIVAIINAWSKKNDIEMQYQIFPLRHKGEIPDHSFDIYLSTGGPGSPIDSVGSPWDNLYVKWLQDMLSQQKPVLLICHSFQIACRHFNFGNVCLRKSTQIGVLPVHPLVADPIFANLNDPFYTLESRLYQIIEPNDENINKLCKIHEGQRWKATPLYIASKNCNTDVVEFLLKQPGIVVNAKSVAKYCTEIRKVRDNPPNPNYQSIIFHPIIIVWLMILPIHLYCSI